MYQINTISQRRNFLSLLFILLCSGIGMLFGFFGLNVAVILAGIVGWLLLYRYPLVALSFQLVGFFTLVSILDSFNIVPNSNYTVVFYLVMVSAYLLGLGLNISILKGEMPFSVGSALVFVFAFWMFVSWVLFSIGNEYALTKIGLIALGMVPVFIAGQLMTKERLWRLIEILAIWCFVGCIWGMGRLLFSDGINQFGRFSISENVNPLMFSYSIGYCSVASVAYFAGQGKRRGFLGLLMPVVFILIFASGSRGPLVGLLVTLLVMGMMLDYFKIRHLLLIFSLSLILIALAMPLLSEVSLGRISLLSDLFVTFTDPTTSVDINEVSTDRTLLWKAAIQVWESSPIVGAGLGNFGHTAFGRPEFAHNLFLEMLSETGVIGFFLLILIIALTIRGFANWTTKKDQTLRAWVIGTYIYAFINSSFSGQLPTGLMFWFCTGVAMIFLSRKELIP